ncbi:hypothetical protein FIU82_05995 [Pseudoalteromonas sp. THAF3]|uniref:hypothetical protein n=1 Tax=Pseudoalteromonas sp. THAF3 TaxID=2587843 RepID=UPI001269587C|nr:hypothetical protein [Pseudoalteromonas sp. THAF3]QFU04567.1 hypothetical protein FIU82_05995 [Pseudoalteromonas sp. THAF3]
MAHYDCSYCGEFGCPGDCPEGQAALNPKPKNTAAPVKSDGGSSAYYTLTITNKNGETFECETGDIIRALVANDFSLGNIVKACRRVSEALQGRGKEGVDPAYDLNKIIYFAEEIKHHAIR